MMDSEIHSCSCERRQQFVWEELLTCGRKFIITLQKEIVKRCLGNICGNMFMVNMLNILLWECRGLKWWTSKIRTLGNANISMFLILRHRLSKFVPLSIDQAINLADWLCTKEEIWNFTWESLLRIGYTDKDWYCGLTGLLTLMHLNTETWQWHTVHYVIPALPGQ